MNEDRLDVGLTAAGADDVLGRPGIPIGHENEPTEHVA